MKLSSFFVAAMVITSVNAGRFSKLVRNIGIFRLTRSSATSSATSSVTSSVTFSLEPSPSPSPAPDSRPDAVQRQMDKSPIIKNAFNNDEDHNAMLMDMYNSKEEILQLAGQIERKCLGYIDNTEEGDDTTQTKFVEGFNSDNIDYKDVIKLLSEVDECLNDFVKFETEYLDKYTHLPDDASILSSEDVQGIVKSIKDDLKSII